MAASPAVPGMFFCFAAAVLLIFVSVSSPTWERISFLNVGTSSTAGTASGVMHFGVFGYTGSGTHIGYPVNVNGVSQDSLNHADHLTKALILHPIAAGLAGLAFLFGVCGASYHRAGTILMALLASFATIVTLVIFVIDMVLWGIARNKIRDAGIPAQYGNANWLTVGALVALLLGACTGVCGSFGRYRRRRDVAY